MDDKVIQRTLDNSSVKYALQADHKLPFFEALLKRLNKCCIQLLLTH